MQKIECPVCQTPVMKHKLNQHIGSRRCINAIKSPEGTGYAWKQVCHRIAPVSDMLLG